MVLVPMIKEAKAERGSGLDLLLSARPTSRARWGEDRWRAWVSAAQKERSHLICSGLEPEIAISSSGFVKPACLDMFVRVPTL